jgi:anti-anti-sigma factor
MSDARAVVLVPVTRWVVAMPGEDRRHVIQHALETAERESPRVVLDASRLTHIFSHQVGSILAAHKRLEEAGGHLAVCGPTPLVRRVLELLQLQEILHIYESAEVALGSLGWTAAKTVELDLPTCD